MNLKHVIPVLAALALAALACNLPAPVPETAAPAGETPATPVTEATATIPPAPPESVCLQAGDGQVLYVSEQAGVCFLHPADFAISGESDPLRAFFLGPLLIPSPSEPLYAAFQFNVLAVPGVAYDTTAAGWADERIREEGVQGIVTRTDVTVADLPGVVVDGMPGMFMTRYLWVVANDTLYEFLGVSSAAGDPALEAVLAGQWALLQESLRFFTPDYSETVLKPEDVCPQAGPDTVLYTSRKNGYCLLYPAGYTADATFPGNFYGGPEVANLTLTLEPQASLTIGLQPFRSEPLEEIAAIFAGAAENPALATQEQATIGGHPAIVITDLSGPVPDRLGLVKLGDNLYTLLVQPVDFDAYPLAEEGVNALWNTITGSIAFFEPWQ